MRRFDKAQVDDRVYSIVHGHGKIQSFMPDKIQAVFNGTDMRSYTVDGKWTNSDAEPILFYTDGTNNYLTERPEPKKEINWQEWEGKEIEIFHEYFGTWEKRKLIKYLPEKENSFLCETGQDSELYTAFDKARLIQEKEPEIDWSLVPYGTKVKGSDTSVLHASERDDDYIRLFLKYIPESPYPFYMFAEGEIEEAMGWTYCALAEPCKPEWLKKDNN